MINTVKIVEYYEHYDPFDQYEQCENWAVFFVELSSFIIELSSFIIELSSMSSIDVVSTCERNWFGRYSFKSLVR